MSNLKTHWKDKGCGRGRRVTENLRSVSCANCKGKDAYRAEADREAAEREAAFQAQVPRTIPKMWHGPGAGNYECSNCGGDLWRERERSLWSFHFVCAGCGNSIHPLTETGMCT